MFILSNSPVVFREVRFSYYGHSILFALYFTLLLMPWSRVPFKARTRDILMAAFIALTVYAILFLIYRLIGADTELSDTPAIGIITFFSVILIMLLQIPAVLWERRKSSRHVKIS